MKSSLRGRVVGALALVGMTSIAEAGNIVANDRATMNLTLRGFTGERAALPGVDAVLATRGMWITLGTLPSGGLVEGR